MQQYSTQTQTVHSSVRISAAQRETLRQGRALASRLMSRPRPSAVRAVGASAASKKTVLLSKARSSSSWYSRASGKKSQRSE